MSKSMSPRIHKGHTHRMLSSFWKGRRNLYMMARQLLDGAIYKLKEDSLAPQILLCDTA